MSTLRGDDSSIPSGYDAGTSGTLRAGGDDITSGFGPPATSTVRTSGPAISTGITPTTGGTMSTGDVLTLNTTAYRYERIISKSTGEAEIFLLSQDGKECILKLYYPNFKPKDDILKALKQIKHSDIINVIDYGYHHDRFFEVMDYAKGGTLEQYLPIKDAQRLRTIVAETVNGYKFCHENGIVHKDIKPGNLYCRNEDGSDILIGDFGISSALDAGMSRHLTSQSLTVGYAAPEMYGIGGKVYVGKEVDYYALGITLIHLWDGKSPFDGLTIHAIANLTSSGKVRIPGDVPREFQNLVKGLITTDYTKRWGYGEIQRWLKGEEVPVHFRITEISYPAFQFGPNEEASTPEALAGLLKASPDKGKKLLYSGKVSAWINLFAHSASVELDQVVEEDYPRDQNAGLQKAIYLLDPDEPFLHGERSGRSAQELAAVLDDEFSAAVDSLANANHPFYLYLEAHDAKAEANTFRLYYSTFSRKKALNTIILELQGHASLKFGNLVFDTPEDLLAHSDRAFLVRMLKDKESRASLWIDGSSSDLIKQQLDAWRSLKKCDEATLAYVSPTENGVPQIEISRAQFSFTDVRIGSSLTDSFTVRNTGGGILSGPIVTDKRWIKVQPQNLDPKLPQQDIAFSINAKGLPFGARDVAQISIQSNVGVETVEVDLTIEAGVKAAARFRIGMTIAAALLGALIGFAIPKLSYAVGATVPSAIIVGLVAVLGLAIFAGWWAKRSYKGPIKIVLLTLVACLAGLGALYVHFALGVSIIAWAVILSLTSYAIAPWFQRHLQLRNRLVLTALGAGAVAGIGALIYADFRVTKQLMAGYDSTSVPPELASILSAFAPKPEPVRNAVPPTPIIDTEFFLCCDDRGAGTQLKLDKDQPVHESNNASSRIIANFKKGTNVRLAARQVHHHSYPMCEVRSDRSVDFTLASRDGKTQLVRKRLRAGETYAYLFGDAAGRCRVWYAGTIYWTQSCPKTQALSRRDKCAGESAGKNAAAGQVTASAEIWDQVRLKNGTRGWIVSASTRSARNMGARIDSGAAPASVVVPAQPAPTRATSDGASGPLPLTETMPASNGGCRVWKPNLRAEESVTWEGECVNGFAQGPGVAKWTANGVLMLRYEGNFQAGKLEGQGKMSGADGDSYDGDHKGGLRDSRGIYITHTGERYEGEYRENKRHGKGIFVAANGDRYEGDYVNNKREGTGIFVRPSGERYEGQYQNDRRHGQGVLINSDGTRFEGMFQDGKPVGAAQAVQ